MDFVGNDFIFIVDLSKDLLIIDIEVFVSFSNEVVVCFSTLAIFVTLVMLVT